VASVWLMAGCGATSVADLAVGNCLNGPELGSTATEVAEVNIKPCSGPHELEVFASRKLSGTYSGQEALLDDTTAWCVSQFKNYVGIDYAESVYFVTQLVPTRESWDDGDREALCLLTIADGMSAGTARNARR